jgi:riboflavin synthase
MFTGIISAIGTVKSTVSKSGSLTAIITSPFAASSIELGASIACSGICLTVTQTEQQLGTCLFHTDISPETLALTNAKHWQTGTTLNLERALKMGDELGGHIVTGHVDGLAALNTIQKMGESYRLDLTAPDSLARFIAAKGSVTLDGISLTVNGVEKNRFWVQIIPHTWAHTTLHQRKAGDTLHLEIDVLARYMARIHDYEAGK